MRRSLATLIAGFGSLVILVALLHIIGGPHFFPGAMPANASLDSEDRFLGALLLSYGCALWWCSRDLELHAGKIHVLLLVLFLGGCARLLSIYVAGVPHPLIIALTALDLLLPPVLAAMLSKVVSSELPGRRPQG